VAGGCSDKRIARELGITAKTVAHHVQHVYDKIGVRSRAGAALFAVEHRLVR
jgi:DNA-binding NarL/FixJ family response regulator